MNKPEREALDAYYAEAGSWADDRATALTRSRRTAWIVASAACTVAVLEALALVVLMPLKTVEPYTLLVDRQTGFVQALAPLAPERVSADAALTQSFMVQYVIAREGYSYQTVQSDYRKVALWSGGRTRANYVASMQPNNPLSPIARLGRNGRIAVEVKSVTPLDADTAMVRFDANQLAPDGSLQTRRSWVSVASFAYSGEPMSIADRFTNPLGFQVLGYSRSEEALPTATPATSAPSRAPVMGRPEPSSQMLRP